MPSESIYTISFSAYFSFNKSQTIEKLISINNPLGELEKIENTMSTWTKMRDLTGGGNNEGIAVVIKSGTGMLAIRKRLNPMKSKDSMGDEVSMMKKLAHHPNIVQIYDFVPASEETAHKDEIYMEYCKTIVRGEEINTIHEISQMYMRKRETIPELFLWHLFEGMLRAIVFMHFGIRNEADEPNPEWEAIFHNDMYSVNIFLSSGKKTKTMEVKAEYPRVVVGDFGQANTASGIQAYCVRRSESQGSLFQRPDNKDVDSVFVILKLFTGPQDCWKFSPELREMMLCLKGIKDGSRTILTLLKTLIKTKERLVGEGKLVFKPLLE